MERWREGEKGEKERWSERERWKDGEGKGEMER